ncbi:hypothetical protein ACQ9LF_05660 [Anaerohalosphaeraceae bacterium U12dextr]
MVSTEKMLRVSKSRPCPICGKPDWCLRADDGLAAICARIADGSIKQCGQAGWLHVLKTSFRQKRRVFSRQIPIATNSDHFSELATQCQYGLDPTRLESVARELKVSQQSLERLGIGWDGIAYTFPMSGSNGHVVGIRRRFPDGSKGSVEDSQNGLFIPAGLKPEGVLLVCEGPTDTAAALDLGYEAVGRANCSSSPQTLAGIVRHREVIIIADNDLAGQHGAKKLAVYLLLFCRCLRIFTPPVKDIRQWVIQESNTGLIRQSIEHAAEIKVNYHVKTGAKV